jgi:protein TonB
MREANANVPRGENLAAILPWLDDTEEVRHRRVLRRGLTIAAGVHVALLSLPLIAPEALPPRVLRLDPFRLAPTPVVRPPQPPEPPPVIPEAPPRVATRRIPVPELPEPRPLPRPLAPLPVELPARPQRLAPLDDLPLPAAPPAAPEAVTDFGPGIEAPRRLSGAPPVYTEMARRVRAGGVVVVEAIIDRDGRVVEARALQGLPWGLTESALRAVEGWRFAPARRHGRPLAVRYQLTVVFELH